MHRIWQKISIIEKLEKHHMLENVKNVINNWKKQWNILCWNMHKMWKTLEKICSGCRKYFFSRLNSTNILCYNMCRMLKTIFNFESVVNHWEKWWTRSCSWCEKTFFFKNEILQSSKGTICLKWEKLLREGMTHRFFLWHIEYHA